MLIQRWVAPFTAVLTVITMGFGSLPAMAQTYTPLQTYVTTTASSSTPADILNRLMQANGISTSRIQSISLVKSDTLNASTDGQKIYVTTGLWNTLQTDDQRAFTIAHELSHVAMNHVQKSQVRQIGLGLLNAFLARKTSNDWVNLVREGSLSLVDRKFSRTDEYGADDLGLQMMKKAGYNPMAAIEVFNIFEQAARRSRTPEFMQDHPLNKSRIETLARKHQLGINTVAY